MTHGHTKESLVAFRDRVADAFRDKRIRSPVHFPGGEEDQLIAALADMRPEDYLCCGWRSMYPAIIKSNDPEWVFGEMLAGRSMYLMSAKYRILSSSIVGGILPVACGLAMGIKRNPQCHCGLDTSPDGFRVDIVCPKHDDTPSLDCRRVWVVVGDMTATTGLYHEFVRYCAGHDLPVRIVICDNGLSTNANTEQTWGTQYQPPPVTRFKYERTFPHVGLLQRVSF